MLDTGREDGLKDPAVLAAIERLEAFLRAQPNVRSTQSVTGYFKDLRRAFHGNDQREYRLPETREEIAQYLLLYEMDKPDGDLREYVTFDYRRARVTARVNMTSSNDAVTLGHDIERYIAAEMPDDIHGTVTGLMVLYANLEEYIRDSLLRGFGGALFSIFIVFCFQMGSVGLGAVVMLANTMPILITLGFMGMVGIRLDSMTAMVASISIGLSDDDSIHFVSRVRLKLEQGSRHRHRAARSAGRGGSGARLLGDGALRRLRRDALGGLRRCDLLRALDHDDDSHRPRLRSRALAGDAAVVRRGEPPRHRRLRLGGARGDGKVARARHPSSSRVSMSSGACRCSPGAGRAKHAPEAEEREAEHEADRRRHQEPAGDRHRVLQPAPRLVELRSLSTPRGASG